VGPTCHSLHPLPSLPLPLPSSSCPRHLPATPRGPEPSAHRSLLRARLRSRRAAAGRVTPFPVAPPLEVRHRSRARASCPTPPCFASLLEPAAGERPCPELAAPPRSPPPAPPPPHPNLACAAVARISSTPAPLPPRPDLTAPWLLIPRTARALPIRCWSLLPRPAA
jgi:hypothetical protein